MSTNVPGIEKFQRVLKGLIFGKGLHYHDLAAALDLSLSTAKRLLNRDDLSLEAIMKICKWLQVDFYKVVELTRETAVEWEYFSPDQEAFFASHMRHYKFLKLLLRGMSINEIVKQEGISKGAALLFLTDLKSIDLIESEPQNLDSIVPCKIGPRPDFVQYGALWNTVTKDMTRNYIETYFKSSQSRKHTRFEYGQRQLSTHSYRAFCREVDDLYKKYVLISEMEVETHSQEELEKMTFFCIVDNIWTDWLETISLKT